jgi:hypothetical protein
VSEWKLVPVEPTGEMCVAGDAAYSWNVAKIFKAMLAAAPQPPALGGEPEVLGYAIRGLSYSLRHTRAELDKLTVPFEEDQIVELIDRGHVAPLLAEIGSKDKELSKLADDYCKKVDELIESNAERDTLKARCEVLEAALSGMVEYFPEGHSDGECFSIDTAKAVLNKATPAAKDGAL